MKGMVLVALAILTQGRVLFEAPDRSLSIANFSESRGGVDFETGDYTFWATGKPLRIDSNLQGLHIESPEVDGIIGRGTHPVDKNRIITFARQLDAKGDSVVTFDNKVQHAALVEHAKKFKLDPPAPLETSRVAILKTHSFVYEGDQAKGVFTMPNAFTLEFRSEGTSLVEIKDGQSEETQKVRKRTESFATANGTSGTLDLLPLEQRLRQIQGGHIKGRPKFHITLVETTEGQPTPQTSVLDAEADELQLSMTETRTVKLIGNVVLTGTSNAYAGKTEADEAVITLDENMKPIYIRFTGAPINSRIRENKPGGQQR